MKSESRNSFLIELPSRPCDSLDWRSAIASAEQASLPIVWKIAAGLEEPSYPLADELRFQSTCLALRQFTNEVWPKFQKTTQAVCLYRGNAMAGEAFALYCQMLSHKLPDELEIWLLFDFALFHHPSEVLQVLANERLEHFKVAIRGMELQREGTRWEGDNMWEHSISSATGIVFPENAHPNTAHLLQQHPDAKILFERRLSSEWEGIDRLFAIRGSLGRPCERELQGFCAAGGEVIYI